MAGQTLENIVQMESQRTGVPAQVIHAVIGQESSFSPIAVSRKGAQGLMQLMPATATRFGASNPFDPADNIRAGTTYLAWLYKRYQNWPLALAGYNAGEGAVDKYNGIPPYSETRNYVSRIMGRLGVTNIVPDTPDRASAPASTMPSPYYASLFQEPEPPQSEPAPQSSRPDRTVQPHKGQPSHMDMETAARTASVFFGEGG